MNVRLRVPGRVRVVETDAPLFRLFALGSGLALLAVFLHQLYAITVITGGTWRLAAVTVAALVGATAMALFATERTAAVVAGLLAVAGTAVYFLSVSLSVDATMSLLSFVLADTLSLLTGRSVLLIQEVSIWAAALAPLPVFLTWYLSLQRRYALASLAGGSMVLFFILTGDLGMMAALTGVLSVLCLLGFGELERRGGTSSQVDLLIVLLAVMAVSGLFVTVVPGGDGDTLSAAGFGGGEGPGSGPGGGGDGSLEGSLISDDGELAVGGSADLSPEIRFTVESDMPRRWRTETYDRYTGDGWTNTDRSSEPYDGELDPPEGPTRPVEQSYEFHVRSDAMPAAAHPTEVHGDAADITTVRDDGSLSLAAAFSEGDSYSVESAVHISTEAALNNTGTDYPSGIDEQYTQVPSSTPDRVGELTDEVTSDADTPYEAALLIEQFLQDQNDYSLEVDQPSGDIADQFLFEMDAGYCTYFATTMATMLRTQEIPTRMAVGYNAGQEVDDGEYLVRGSDAHAWVEVYFEDIGWVEFDPTPAAEWTDARSSAVQEGRIDGDVEVDINESEGEPYFEDTDDDPFGDDDEADEPLQGGFVGAEEGAGVVDPTDGEPDDEEIEQILGAEYSDPSEVDTDRETDGGVGAVLSRIRGVLPSGERITLALALFVTTVAGARSTGMTKKTRRTVELYWQRPGADPDADAQRAANRVERHLERTYRPRNATESRLEYLGALPFTIDDNTGRVFDVAERATYGDGVSREEANEAIELADEIVASDVPLLGRLR